MSVVALEHSRSPSKSKGLVSGNLIKNSTDSRLTRSSVYSCQPDNKVTSGVYLVKATAGERIITKKVVYLK